MPAVCPAGNPQLLSSGHRRHLPVANINSSSAQDQDATNCQTLAVDRYDRKETGQADQGCKHAVDGGADRTGSACRSSH